MNISFAILFFEEDGIGDNTSTSITLKEVKKLEVAVGSSMFFAGYACDGNHIEAVCLGVDITDEAAKQAADEVVARFRKIIAEEA
ncbi:MAG: hypothetical protein HZC26_03360 [Candidatus Magasanikbacteria bacterium]|nr:hypothetical protein [Candidatus Magasanikbacteria bacterium]